MSRSGALRQGIGLWGVVSLGLGTAVGVSIFSAMAPATALAGPAMLLSVLVAALPMYVIAVSYAYLGSAIPVSGASFAWPARFLHPLWGFLVAWMRIIGSMGAMVVLALVLVQYLSMVVDLPARPAMFAILLLALLANLAGVAFTARVQTAMIVALIVLFAVLVAWGAPAVDASRFEPFAPSGSGGVLAAMPLLIGLFFGIEAATETGPKSPTANARSRWALRSPSVRRRCCIWPSASWRLACWAPRRWPPAKHRYSTLPRLLQGRWPDQPSCWRRWWRSEPA